MSINIRDYVSDDHIESISEIATGQAKIIQALSLDNSQKDKEIERLNELVKGLREERDYLFNKTTTESNYEIERLHTIIKEDRKLLEKIYKVLPSTYNQLLIEIKQILDKGSDKE